LRKCDGSRSRVDKTTSERTSCRNVIGYPRYLISPRDNSEIMSDPGDCRRQIRLRRADKRAFHRNFNRAANTYHINHNSLSLLGREVPKFRATRKREPRCGQKRHHLSVLGAEPRRSHVSRPLAASRALHHNTIADRLFFLLLFIEL
jgi:hypothetical protein